MTEQPPQRRPTILAHLPQFVQTVWEIYQFNRLETRTRLDINSQYSQQFKQATSDPERLAIFADYQAALIKAAVDLYQQRMPDLIPRRIDYLHRLAAENDHKFQRTGQEAFRIRHQFCLRLASGFQAALDQRQSS